MSHNAGQPALPLHREMWVVKLEPKMVSHSAPISDCEKCWQWQPAPPLPRETSEPKLEPDIITYGT
eukprot:8194569-Pyramimonas_sp.AAC.1